jgi:hypothetical protein
VELVVCWLRPADLAKPSAEHGVSNDLWPLWPGEQGRPFRAQRGLACCSLARTVALVRRSARVPDSFRPATIIPPSPCSLTCYPVQVAQAQAQPRTAPTMAEAASPDGTPRSAADSVQVALTKARLYQSSPLPSQSDLMQIPSALVLSTDTSDTASDSLLNVSPMLQSCEEVRLVRTACRALHRGSLDPDLHSHHRILPCC